MTRYITLALIDSSATMSSGGAELKCGKMSSIRNFAVVPDVLRTHTDWTAVRVTDA
jgi:hypothetical protein